MKRPYISIFENKLLEVMASSPTILQILASVELETETESETGTEQKEDLRLDLAKQRTIIFIEKQRQIIELAQQKL